MSDKKIAIVTGASRGIGAAIAKSLVEEGFFVVGTATSESGADAISTMLSDHGKGYPLDIKDADSVSTFIKCVEVAHGSASVLVNNAGITNDGLLPRIKEEDWMEVINTNLNGVYRLSKACIRGMMKQREGRIISIGSVVGQSGNPGQTSYSAAKAALSGFSKSLAREVGSRGITVNVVAPGYIQTDMTNALSDEQKENITGGIPMGRMGEVEDISALVSFLASDAASYITGQTIAVNGGMYMA